MKFDRKSRVYRSMVWSSACTLAIGYIVLMLLVFLPSFHRLPVHDKNIIVGVIFLLILGPLSITGLFRILLGLRQRLRATQEVTVNLIIREILSPAIGDLYEIYSRTRSSRGGLRAAGQFCIGFIISLPRLLLQAIVIVFFESYPSEEYQNEFLDWYGQMIYTSENLLTEEEKQSLKEWDQTEVDGSGKFATSDWPGWEKYIGLPPWKRK